MFMRWLGSGNMKTIQIFWYFRLGFYDYMYDEDFTSFAYDNPIIFPFPK